LEKWRKLDHVLKVFVSGILLIGVGAASIPPSKFLFGEWGIIISVPFVLIGVILTLYGLALNGPAL
jgi:hypothetical protein